MMNPWRAERAGIRDTSFVRLRHLPVILFCLTLCLSIEVRCESESIFPRRIISLGPTITEKLYLLGVEERIVGVTIYCNRPSQAALKEKVGNVTHASIEKIVRLKPDLVLATSLTDSRLIEKLRRARIRTEVFPEAKSFEELNKQFVHLGKMVGREGKAHRVAALADHKVRAISHGVGGQRKTKVFCQIGAQPLFTAVGDTLLNDFIERANGINIARGAKIGFYNREEVIRQNPDVIIIVTMGIAAEREKQAWQRFKSVNAVRNGRVAVMDAYRTCSPTPLTFADALAEFAAILHPESLRPSSNPRLGRYRGGVVL
ncbi:MAG TPA: ABC transporter substrate-binding protein [Deltaproteobacteria bacterium]|nr:ABC transporter substrate-binding protein [Deltaproteobacteria bacterium]